MHPQGIVIYPRGAVSKMFWRPRTPRETHLPHGGAYCTPMGSIGVAAWIAKLAFLALLAWGWISRDLGRGGGTVFLVLGAAAWLGLPRISNGENFVTPALALIDIALVFAIFKGDLRIG